MKFRLLLLAALAYWPTTDPSVAEGPAGPTATPPPAVAPPAAAPAAAATEPAPNSASPPTAPASTNIAPDRTAVLATTDTNAAPTSPNLIAASTPPALTDTAVAAIPAPNPGTAPPVVTATNAAPVGAVTDTGTTNAAPPELLIRFDFSGMPYAEVLQRFAQMTGKPLIAETAVDGTLTFVDPQPYTYGAALDTLNLILATKNVMLVEVDRYLRLIPFKALPQMPLPIFQGLAQTGEVRPGEIVTVVLELQNLNAAEVSQSIAGMLSSAGSVAALSRGRGLIVTDRLANIQRVQQLLDQVDTASPTQRELKTYRLRNASGTLLTDLINRTFGVATAPKRTLFNEQRKSYETLPPDPTDYVTAIFAEPSNTLVLFGPAERIALADDLIQRFETEAGARASEIRIFYPQMAAEELANMVRQALPGVASRSDGGRDREGVDLRARVIPDPSSNRLIVTAPAAGQLDAIADLIQRLDPTTRESAPAQRPEQTAPARELRLVDLRSGSAQYLAPMLREALAELGRDQTGPAALGPVRIQPSPSGNRLLLTGTPQALDHVTRLIEQLDGTGGQPELTRVFRLQHANAARVANMITSVLGSSDWRRRSSGGTVTVAAEERSNSVVVSAPDAQMKLIEEVITRLEEVGSTAGRQLKLLALTNSSAATVSSALTRLFAPQVSSYDPAQRIALSAAPDDRAVLVEADERMLPRLEEAVRSLDAGATRRETELRVFEIESGSAQALAQMLREALVELARGGGGGSPLGPVYVQGSPLGNRLLVSGSTEALERVAKLVTQLDGVPPAQSARVFPLKNADARQVANMIMSSMSTYEMRRRGGGYPMAAAEERSNSVVVSAPDAQMKLIEEVITRLEEVGSTAGRQLRILPVANNSAASIVAMVSQLFFPQVRSADVSQRIALTAAPDDRAIVVEAADALMARLQEAVQALDVEPARGVIEVRTYALPEGRSSELSEALNRLFAEPPDARRRLDLPGPPTPPAPRFELDGATDTLIAAATPDQFVRIEKVLDDLRTAAALASQIRTFRLEHGDPTQIVDVLQNLLVPSSSQRWASARTVRSMGGEVRVTAAPVLNAVVMQASPEKLAIATQLIQTLDQPRAAGASAIQAVHLQKAQPEAVASAVMQMLSAKTPPTTRPTTSVTAVSGSSSLLINGPPAEVQAVLELVRELDQESPATQVETRVFRLEHGTASELTRVLNQLLQGLGRAQPRFATRFQRDTFTVAADDRTNALIVSGTADHFKLVEQLLPTLDQAPQRLDREVQFYWLESALASDVAPKLEALFSDRPKTDQPIIEPDLFSNSLTIVAKPVDLVEIEAIIQRLDATARDTSLVVRMIPLTQMPVDRLAGMLTNIYSQLSQGEIRLVDRLTPLPPRTPAPTSPAEPAPLQPAPAPAPPPQTSAPAEPGPSLVTIAVDKTANALIASGPAFELDYIQSLISQLTLSFATPEFEIRQFRLREADPVVVARVLNELFKPIPVPGQPQPGGESRGGGRDGASARRQEAPPVQTAPDGRQQQQAQAQAATPKVAVVAESRTQSVIIRARPGDFPLLESIIQQLDEGGLSSQLAHRVVPLVHVSPERMLSLVRQVLTQLNAVRPGEPVVVASDPRSRGLFLVGRESVLDQVATLARELDTASEFAEIELRVVTLKNALAAPLAALLRNLLKPDAANELTPEARQLQEQISRLKLADDQGNPIRLDLTQPIRILADPPQAASAAGANRLVLGSTPNNLEALVAVAALLDTVPLTEGITARLIRLQHVDAALVAQTLNAIFQQGLSAGPAGTRRTGRGAGATPAPAPAAASGLGSALNVAVDARSNLLILSGHEETLALAAAIIRDLDQDLPDDLRRIRILRLEHADAAAVASSLQRVLDERVRQRSGAGRAAPADPMRVVVIADPRSNSLLISGSPANFELVESLVAQLDEPAAALAGQIRLIPLTHANAQTLAATLADLFTRRYQSARSPDLQRQRPVIVADSRGNSLLVAASVDDNQVLDALLLKLDREPETAAVELTVIGLQHNDSAAIATTLRSVFAARLQSLTPTGQAPAPSDRVDVQPDSLSNALIVSASPQNLELVRSLVAKLDAEPVATGGLIQTFTLEHADVQRVSTMLRTLIDQGVYRPGVSAAGGRRSPRDALAIAADAPSNTLIVSASPENLLIVRELLRQLDTAELVPGGDIKLYTLRFGRASHLATVLEQFFRAKRAGESAAGTRGRTVPVTVTADDRTNTLLITGGKEDFAALDRMIEQLDAEQSLAKTSFRVFELKHTTATKLQTTLQRLFTNRPPRIQGQPPEPVTIIADGWANALIVGAADDDLNMAASLIERLDAPQPEGGPQVQVFQLVKADARRVEQTLQSLFRGAAAVPAAAGVAPVLLQVDERLNAIIVSAGEADLKRIDELVKKLDTDQLARVAEIRIFPLKNARAAETATILNNVLNNNPRALTEESPNRQSLLQFIARAEQGQQLITSALKEGIIIVPDSRANSLVVSAPVDYMNLLDQIIRHLDEAAPTIAKIKVFNLKNADARQMALVLTSLFRLQAAGGAASANAQYIRYTMPRAETAASGEAEAPAGEASAIVGSAEDAALTVTVDLRTNSLLIGGTDHYVALASQIVDTLDGTPAQERKAEVYRLKNSRAQSVEVALRTFLQQDLQRIMTILGPTGVGTAQNVLDREVSIVSETNANSLLISASPRYFSEVRSLVEQLDQPQPQVLIQVLLAEVTLDAKTELGVEWNYASKGSPLLETGTDFGQKQLFQNFGGYSAAVTGSNYRFLLRALENEGRLEVLSRPQILTADNQEATINIGQRVPLVTDSRVTERGDTINQFTYEDIGVTLRVVPRISPDGYVKMDVEPRVSNLSSSTIDISKDVSIPVINQRTATTTVTVKSGESILIGGLIGTSDDARTKKVPLLGDIPGLGALFRSRTKAQDRKELLVILTPQILIKGEGDGQSVDARTFTEQELQQSDLRNQMQRDALQKRILDPIYPAEPELEGQPQAAPTATPRKPARR
ncbi:MAG: hypothetical protein FJ387_11715 [Verrucomicrobia bacterium]|nr:hypothetical protein [Verrucomicrobiota bacterium]